jgi:hypothetical protein
MTTRVVERVVKSPVGVYGLFALPFLTLGMEKSIYDTVQSWQGIDPNVVPKDRGGFPSGGASEYCVQGSCVMYAAGSRDCPTLFFATRSPFLQFNSCTKSCKTSDYFTG